MGRMDYRRFVISSLIGAFAWISVWSVLGYYLGQFKIVQDNLTKIILGIVLLVSVVAIIKLIAGRRKK